MRTISEQDQSFKTAVSKQDTVALGDGRRWLFGFRIYWGRIFVSYTFGTTLGMEEGQEERKTEMELNNLQQQQDPSSMFDPTASSSSCFQIPHDQPMFATDHHHQNWVSDSMFGSNFLQPGFAFFTPSIETI
ncbi:hypothetical protein YC2023_070530 [Brassica napus]